MLEDTRYQLGTALARLGERDEAQKVLKDVAAGGRAYASMAKAFLAALETGSDLPLLPEERGKRATLAPAKPTVAGASAPRPGLISP